MTTVGFIGLGSWGCPWRRTWQRAASAFEASIFGRPLWTRLSEAGIARVVSAADAARSDAYVLMVERAQAEAILFQDGGLATLPRMGPWC